MATAKLPPASVVFGKGGSEPPEPEGAEVPEDFEAYAIEAFPELEGNPDAIAAFKHAVEACVRRYNTEE